MDAGELVQNISEKPPWWATAPIWLAAGIVGVPSLMAIGAGYFIAGNVTTHLTEISVENATALHELHIIQNNQDKYWEMVRRALSMGLEVQLRACVHQATNEKDRDDCMKGISGVTLSK